MLNIYGGGPIIARMEKDIYSKVPIYQNLTEYSYNISKSSHSGSSYSKSDRLSDNNLFSASRIKKNKQQSISKAIN